jgi:hypothetical protein
MRTRFIAVGTALAILVGFCARRAAPQVLERVSTPIVIHVSSASAVDMPSAPGPNTVRQLTVPQGAKVRMYGTSVPIPHKTSQVRLEVQQPDGGIARLVAALEPNGAWSTLFAGTSAPGKYNATAFSIDEQNKASASFLVVSAVDINVISDEMMSEIEQETTAAESALEIARESLLTKRPFPGDERALNNIAEIKTSTDEMRSRLPQAKAALHKLGEIVKQYPGGAGKLEPVTTAMQEATAALADATSKITTAQVEAGKTMGVCDRLDAAIEVFGAVGLGFDVLGKAAEKIIKLLTDKYLPELVYNAAVPAPERSLADKFSMAYNFKIVGAMFAGAFSKEASVPKIGREIGAWTGLLDYIRKPENLASDTVQLLMGYAFDKLCEKFTGPLNGTFSVDAMTSFGPEGRPYWGYSMILTGTMTLMYEKKLAMDSNTPIPLVGEIEGNGHDFKMHEDLMALNEFNRRFVIYRKLVEPAETKRIQAGLDPLGKIARMASPTYFRIPVQGLLKSNKLAVTVNDVADNDFSDSIRGDVYYVVTVPPLPEVLHSTLPVQKAQFIISRGLRKTAIFEIQPVDYETTRSDMPHSKMLIKVASQNFQREEVVSKGEVTVRWNIDVKVCNPACP